MGGIDDGGGHARVAGPLGAHDQDNVARVHLDGGAGQVETGVAVRRLPTLAGLGGESRPGRSSREVVDGLEGLRGMARPRHALHLGSGGNCGRLRLRLEREREPGLGGHARIEVIADEGAEFEHRPTLLRGAQITLVSQPLLVEGQHVEHHGRRVEQRDAEVVALARAQSRQRRIVRARQSRLHAREEAAVVASPIGDARQARTIADRLGGCLRDARAAAAIALGGSKTVHGHWPPHISSARTPFSGKFGSLSRRAISSRPRVISPRARYWPSAIPWRWKVVTRTDATPGKLRAAA